GRPQPSSTRCRSLPQMPQWLTSTMASSAAGSGTGRSSTTITPGRWYTAAGIVGVADVFEGVPTLNLPRGSGRECQTRGEPASVGPLEGQLTMATGPTAARPLTHPSATAR